MSPNQRDLLTQTLDELAEELAKRIAPLLASPPLPVSPGAPGDGLGGLPERQHLTQREAAEWTRKSVSTLRRARKNGLPYTMALGQVTYHVDDLRDFLNGKYNG